MLVLRVALLTIALPIGGCRCLTAGSYSTGPSKHPTVLTLDCDGTYLLRVLYTDKPDEPGRWWTVTNDVVVLLPDDSTRAEHYASLKKGPLSNLRLSDDLRGAMPR